MATENELDADDFTEDFANEAGEATEEVAETSEDESSAQAALDEIEEKPETEETTEEVESKIAEVLAPGVPVEQVAKIRKGRAEARQRADAAEAKLKELETTRESAPEKTEDLDSILSDLDEDEPVEKGQVIKLVKEVQKRTAAQVMTKLEEQEQQKKVTATLDRAKESEVTFKKETPDYDAVISAAATVNVKFSDDDLSKVALSDNPAKTFYELNKAKLNAARTALGIPSASPTTEKKAGDEEVEGDDTEKTEDEIFDAIFGEEQTEE